MLDLFAGSGALGFEALSRGAASAVFVESARSVVKLIQKNAESLQVSGRVVVIEDSVMQVPELLLKHGPFDVVLADPPYAGGWEEKLLFEFPWDRLLASGGFFCLEWGPQKSHIASLPANAPHLVKVREKNYGDSVLTTYQAVEQET